MLLLSAATDAAAQPTTVLRDKTQIKPQTGGAVVADADTLRIWGGLQAGPAGDIQVIAADGTISVAAAIADGTITFAKWHDNGCASSDVPSYDGTAWVCASVAAVGGLTASSSPTITGDWRFSTNTVFGDAIAPQQLIHLYESGAQVGIRLQGAASWDLATSGANLVVAVGGSTIWTTTSTGLGIGTVPTTALDVTGVITGTGLAINGGVASHLRPTSGDTYDLGTSTQPWKTAYISTIPSTVFTETTATLFGGHSIIGKNAGTFGAAVSSGATSIDFGKAMTPSTWALVRAHDTSGTIRAEYILIGSLVGGTTYNVTRDLAATSSPDPAWADGTPYLVLGANGDGRIELNAYTTPKISILTQGATYNAASEQIRIGYLDGMPGVAAGKIGFYVGDTTGTQGFSYYDGALTLKGTITASSGTIGGWTLGAGGLVGGSLTLSSTGNIRAGKSTYADTTAGFWLGLDSSTPKFHLGNSSKALTWNGTNFTITGPDITIGSATAYSSAGAIKFARDGTFDSNQVFGLWSEGSGGTYQNLVLENHASRQSFGDAESNVILRARGWSSPSTATDLAEIDLHSEVGSATITVTASNGMTLNGATASRALIKAGYATIGQYAGQYAWMGSNYSLDTSSFYYTNSDYASAINYSAGGFVFYSAASGTAGNSISWTQRAALNASGGFTVNSSTDRMVFESGAAVASAIQFKVSSAALGYVGASGSFLGSSATNMMMAAESGKTVQLFADGSVAKYAELTTAAQWFLYNTIGNLRLSPSGGDSGGAYWYAQNTAGSAFLSTDFYSADYTFRIGTTSTQKIDGNGDWRPTTDNTLRVGLATHRYSLIRGVTITSGDMCFENGWCITESYKVGVAEDGLAFVNPQGELRYFLGENGFKRRNASRPDDDVDAVAYTVTTLEDRAKMDAKPHERVVGYLEDGSPVYRTKADIPMPDPAASKTNIQRKAGGL